MKKKPEKRPQLSQLVDMYDPAAVLAEAKRIFTDRYGAAPFEPVEKAFADVLRLYSGRYPGYCACNTRYHDIMHITDSFLAMARLLDGYNSVHAALFPARLASVGLIAALLHDAGFIQRRGDKKGTGAKYTVTHVARSVAFIRSYLPKNGFGREDVRAASNALWCTDLSTRLSGIGFRGQREKVLGFMLGSADLLGQMASRCYLERLALLYEEFREAGVPGFTSELDLLRKTTGFYRLMDERLSVSLGGVRRYLRAHFRARYRVDRDMYRESMDRQMDFLRSVVLAHPRSYSGYLRRAIFRETGPAPRGSAVVRRGNI